MYNNLFNIGPLTIHGYGLMIAIGVVCALLVTAGRSKKRGLVPDMIYSMGLLAVVFGFIGAKLLYCIIEFKSFLANPLSILSGGGFVVYGGIIAGVLAAYIYCRKKKVSFLKYFDLSAPSISLAQGFGRIGCFLAGCCYGARTDSFFGIVFQNSAFAPNGVKLIPTQLISSGGDFLFAALLLLYSRKPRQDGRVGALYLILYSIGRFIIEFFRGDERGAVGALSTSQFISLFTLVLGIALFFKDKMPWVKKEKTE